MLSSYQEPGRLFKLNYFVSKSIASRKAFLKKFITIKFFGSLFGACLFEKKVFSRLMKFYFKIKNYKLASELDIKILATAS